MRGRAVAVDKVSQVHHALVDFLKAGQTLSDVDSFIGRTLESLLQECSEIPDPRTPAFSKPFLPVAQRLRRAWNPDPMSTKSIEPGDILSVDVGVSYKGWIGDAAWSYGIEAVSETAMNLMRAGRGR